MHPSARPGFGMYFTPIKCPSPGSCGRRAALNTPGTALPLSSQAACNTVFHEIMLEISQNKQKLPIRSVTLPRGAGEHTDVGRCNVSWHPPSLGGCLAPALPAAQAAVPALGSIYWWGPLCTGTTVISWGGLEWQTPLLGTAPSGSVLHRSHCCNRDEKLIFKEVDFLCSFC